MSSDDQKCELTVSEVGGSSLLKYAKCKIETVAGIPGFNLYIHNREYGHYPITENHNSIEQIQMAINDAKNYNYSGIYFE